MSTINERVVEVRKAVGKTQAQFSQKLSIGQAALAMIETGKNELSEKNIKLICLSYGVQEKWLRNGEGNMFEPPENKSAAYVEELLNQEENPLYDLIRAIMKTYSELSQCEKETVKSFAKSLKDSIKSE